MAVVATLCPERWWQLCCLCHHSEGSVALCCVNGLCKAFTATALRHPGEKSMHGLTSFMRIMGPV